MASIVGMSPMFGQDDFKRNVNAHNGYWMTLAERGLRPVDKLDYSIRRWAIDDHPSRIGRSHSLYSKETDARLNEIQRAIGRYLRAEYELTQPMSERLVALVRKVEQPA
jgi:hypothetical protein